MNCQDGNMKIKSNCLMRSVKNVINYFSQQKIFQFQFVDIGAMIGGFFCGQQTIQ